MSQKDESLNKFKQICLKNNNIRKIIQGKNHFQKAILS